MSSYLVDRLIQKIVAILALEPKISELARWINTSELAKNNQYWCFSFSAAIGFSKELSNSVLNEGCCFVGGFLVGWFFFGYDLAVL